MPVWLPVNLSLRLSVCLSTSLSLSPSVCLPLSLSPSVCLPLSLSPSVCLPLSLSPSVCLPLSLPLSVYLSLSLYRPEVTPCEWQDVKNLFLFPLSPLYSSSQSVLFLPQPSPPLFLSPPPTFPCLPLFHPSSPPPFSDLCTCAISPLPSPPLCKSTVVMHKHGNEVNIHV